MYIAAILLLFLFNSEVRLASRTWLEGTPSTQLVHFLTNKRDDCGTFARRCLNSCTILWNTRNFFQRNYSLSRKSGLCPEQKKLTYHLVLVQERTCNTYGTSQLRVRINKITKNRAFAQRKNDTKHKATLLYQHRELRKKKDGAILVLRTLTGLPLGRPLSHW